MSIKDMRAWAMKKWSAAEEMARGAVGSAQQCGEQVLEKTRARTYEVTGKATAVVQDKAFQASAASAAGGALAVGAGGGAVGLASGAVVGAAVGMVPAFFTFGISIPIGAAIGGGSGLIVGVAGGSAMGAVGGVAAGYGVYTKRDDIREFAKKRMANVMSCVECLKDTSSKKLVAPVKARVAAVVALTSDVKAAALAKVTSAQGAATGTYASIKEKGVKPMAIETVQVARAKAVDFAAGAREAVKEQSFQAAALSAAGGAVLAGAGGGAAGLATGSLVGAAFGLVPAIFTFGLSIPIGAAIGGGTGLVTGAAAGTVLGASGGAAMGYSVHARRDKIAEVANQALVKAKSLVQRKVAAHAPELAQAEVKVIDFGGASQPPAEPQPAPQPEQEAEPEKPGAEPTGGAGAVEGGGGEDEEDEDQGQ